LFGPTTDTAEICAAVVPGFESVTGEAALGIFNVWA
jgi:hypothetical protein